MKIKNTKGTEVVRTGYMPGEVRYFYGLRVVVAEGKKKESDEAVSAFSGISGEGFENALINLEELSKEELLKEQMSNDEINELKEHYKTIPRIK